MRKFLTIIGITLLIMSFSVKSLAVTATMEIVEDNICTIDLDDSSSFEKKIVSSDLTNHQVTLQLKISNNSENIIPSGELMLVIDSSASMDTIVSGSTTRKDIVLEAANQLVADLLEVNSNDLQIGVVTFSTGTEKDPETGYLITGTEADAQKVCDFTNDLSTLQTQISGIQGTGQYTNLDAGLKLAKSCFTSENNNKYMIVLTDGLPNLAVGYNDLVSYNGLTDVINETKSTLSSLNGINVTTMLTGIDNEDANFRVEGSNIYTYGQVINAVFGTEENPTIGKFYNINDNDIESTITNDIFHDLVPTTHSLTNITVIDYFPQYIVDNFEMNYVAGVDISNVSSEIDLETNSITWSLDDLASGETAIIQYTLTLKDEFDESIIGEILDTNERIDITYNDFEGIEQEKTSDVTPKVQLIAEPEPEPPEDNTIAPVPLPDTGLHTFIILGFITLIVLSLFFGYKSKKIKIK